MLFPGIKPSVTADGVEAIEVRAWQVARSLQTALDVRPQLQHEARYIPLRMWLLHILTPT